MNATTTTTAAVNFVIMPETLTDRQILNRLHKIAAIEKQLKELTDARDALRAEIVAGRDAVALDTADFIVKYTPVESTRIDSKALRADLPDVAAKYSKTTTSTRFSYKIR